jgi:hypothetical protein
VGHIRLSRVCLDCGRYEDTRPTRGKEDDELVRLLTLQTEIPAPETATVR